MQFPQSPNRTQLPLFDAFLPSAITPLLNSNGQTPWMEETETCSELTLRGSTGHCLNLLAPILRELSQNQDARWLTLIAPPSSLTQTWLRNAGLNRERIMLLHPRGTQSARDLACSVLRLGHSHTVISWLQPLDTSTQQQLASAAQTGGAQSLNISLG